jgi:hypothetical protein
METNPRALQQTPVKDYEIIVYEGKEARRYPNGIIRSPKGYILYLPPEVARQRKEQAIAKARISAEEAVTKGTGSETPEEGWGKIIRARLEVAINDKGRAGNDATRLVGIALGYFRRDDKMEIDKHIHQVNVPELPQGYFETLRRLAESRNRDTIEGKVTDVLEGLSQDDGDDNFTDTEN